MNQEQVLKHESCQLSDNSGVAEQVDYDLDNFYDMTLSLECGNSVDGSSSDSDVQILYTDSCNGSSKYSLCSTETTHSAEKPYNCVHCLKGFTRRSEAARHRWTHTGEKPFVCGVCLAGYQRSDRLVAHIRLHVDQELTCTICHETFPDIRMFTFHCKTHRREKPYKCDSCEKAFSSSSYLRYHRSKIHDIHEPRKEKIVIFKCNVCNKMCKNRKRLYSHRQIHTNERPFVCQFCPSAFKTANTLRQHLFIHSSELYACAVCSKAFKSPARLKAHESIHLSTMEFQCEKCGARFRRKQNLAKHRARHTDKKRYSCRFCSKRFKYAGQLKQHLCTHTGVRRYTCDLCGWKFAQRSRMKSHILTHTGEKPFECKICGRAFRRQDKLTDHCRRVHKKIFDVKKSESEMGCTDQ